MRTYEGAPDTLEAALLRATIAGEADEASDALVSFAQRHAVDPKLRHTALILKGSLARATQPEQRAQVKEEMLALVDALIEAQEADGAAQTARAETEARQRLEEHFRDTTPPHELIFEARGLGKTYKKSGFSLCGVNLSLRRGEITGVVGENANGKTTLFRLVAGELRHDAGTLSFPFLDRADAGVDWVAVNEHLAYVPQELPRWYGSLDDNLRYEAALRGIRGDANRREVDFVIQRLKLEEHLRKTWKQLSGGTKLRFALARGLVWKPKLLLLDEPLANLDFKAQQLVLSDLRDLARSFRYPMAVLISSQHLHEIEAVADHILFLRQGQVTFNGPTETLGEARKYNSYELGCDLGEADLRERLSHLGVMRISHSGVSWVVTTPLEISGSDVLAALLRHGVEVEYFRDISRSVKQLFD